ncbi:hypothetical protein MKW92_048037 [Papaver armeniacum]|nr:hypothetical protein MKW92_048037 [Papaver armeniacum]
MASSSFSIFVLSLLILLSCTQSSSDLDEITSSADASKVSLALYYETLCPYCSRFMVNYLPKIFSNGLIDIIDLKLVPYGNARISADNIITCQHGPNECVLNTVEACAIYVWPSLDYENFQTYVCNAYKGTPPTACQGKQLEISTTAKSNQLVEVTYMDETYPATKIMSRVTKGRRQMKF